MVKGLDTFRNHFAGYKEQYVLIGGAACDIVFESNDVSFRATRDLDMVLIVEALTPELERNFGSLSLMGNIETKQQTVATLNFIGLINQKTMNFRK